MAWAFQVCLERPHDDFCQQGGGDPPWLGANVKFNTFPRPQVFDTEDGGLR
jgi:hypothetical protein